MLRKLLLTPQVQTIRVRQTNQEYHVNSFKMVGAHTRMTTLLVVSHIGISVAIVITLEKDFLIFSENADIKKHDAKTNKALQ